MSSPSRPSIRYRLREQCRRQVTRAGIRRDRRDAMAGPELARYLQRRERDRTTRHPNEQSFFPREAPCEWERILLPRANHSIDDGAIEILWNEPRTHALKLMLPTLATRANR